MGLNKGNDAVFIVFTKIISILSLLCNIKRVTLYCYEYCFKSQSLVEEPKRIMAEARKQMRMLCPALIIKAIHS